MCRIAKGIQKFVIDKPEPFIIKDNHHGQEFRGQAVDEPMQTITAKNGWGVVTPFIKREFGCSVGHSVNDPLGTITAGGMGKSQLVTSHLIKFRGTNIGSPVTEPVHTITAGGLHIGEVRAFLLKYYGVTSKDTFGLVTVRGEQYQIVDIGMRMLEPKELFAAQGFPETYIIDRDCDGKRYSKAAQVARCGNAVPPPLAKALVRANLPELCSKKHYLEACNE
jgi:DNA (cytosine-5)-methyltransferase 1